MLNQPNNATSYKMQNEIRLEKERQIQTQLNELHKQTSTLTDVKTLTHINIECIQNIVSLTSENTETVKQIAKITEENQRAAKKQFWASIIVSVGAMMIAGASFIVSLIQLFK